MGDLTYGYDQAGRRATVGGSFARVAIPDPFSSASYNDNNQLTSRAGVSYSYDDDGNLTDDGTTTYSWNARGQLTGLSRTGLTASFAYDATGRRSGKTINGAATGYLHDGVNPTQELSGTTPTTNLLSGGVDQWLTRSDSTGQRTYLTDALGSTVVLTDSSGAVKTSYTYEPFGKTSATGEANANPMRYTGREDDGTGLYYYRARYYHPGLQRFISEDPAGFAAGDTNLYAYVHNSPTNLTDPSGEYTIVAVCAAGAALDAAIELGSQLAGRKTVNWGWGGVGGAALRGCAFGLLGAGAGAIICRVLGRAAVTRLPAIIYREGTPRPGNLTARAVDDGILSFRDSLSNPWVPPAARPPNWRPVFRPNQPWLAIDTSRLPAGSVIPDNVPPGHVGVRGVSVEEFLEALINRGKFPK